MESLKLTLPQHSRLEKNAHAPILAVLTTLDTIRTACNSFTAENDTRATVSKLYEALGAQVEALADVTNVDQEAEQLGADYTDAHNRYLGSVRFVENKLRYLSTNEEGTKLPQRRMRKAFLDLRNAVGAFTEHHDTRPDAIAAVEAMRLAIADVMLLDLTLDRWYAQQVYEACDSLLNVFAMPIPPPDTPVSLRHQNSQRSKAADAAYDLQSRARSIGYNYHSNLDEAAPIGVRAGAIRAQLLGDLFTPLEDVGAMVTEVRAIKSSAQRLLNAYIPDGKGHTSILRKSVGDAQEAADTLLAILEPRSVPQFGSAPSMLDRFRTKLLPTAGWGWNDHTEGVTK